MENFTKDELLRYSRQLMVSEFGEHAQATLKAASVVIIGAGGLGSAVAVQLASMGIGKLRIIDHDTIELSNLHRQTSYCHNDVGATKVSALKARLQAINSHVQVDAINEKVDTETIKPLVAGVDLVIDGSDNFACRFAVNQHCVMHGIPLVSGAAIRQSGQLISFTNDGSGPCYNCLFNEHADQAETCSSAGVLPPIVTMVAAAQSMAAIQLLCSLPCPSLHVLHRLDLSTMQWRKSHAVVDPDCSCRKDN